MDQIILEMIAAKRLASASGFLQTAEALNKLIKQEKRLQSVLKPTPKKQKDDASFCFNHVE